MNRAVSANGLTPQIIEDIQACIDEATSSIESWQSTASITEEESESAEQKIEAIGRVEVWLRAERGE